MPAYIIMGPGPAKIFGSTYTKKEKFVEMELWSPPKMKNQGSKTERFTYNMQVNFADGWSEIEMSLSFPG